MISISINFRRNRKQRNAPRNEQMLQGESSAYQLGGLQPQSTQRVPEWDSSKMATPKQHLFPVPYGVGGVGWGEVQSYTFN